MFWWIVLILVILLEFEDLQALIGQIAQISSPLREFTLFILITVVFILIYIMWGKIVHGIKVRGDIKKPQIIDEINKAIVPLILQLKTEHHALKEKQYKFQSFHDEGGYLGEIKTFPRPLPSEKSEISYEIPIQRLRKERVGVLKLKKFGSKIDTRNILVGNLEDVLKELTDLLRPKVEEIYPILLEQYNHTLKNQHEKIDLEPYITISSIIDKRKKLDASNSLKDFWKAHGEELLNLRKLPDIKEQIKVVNGITGELEYLSIEMLGDLEHLKKRYVDNRLTSEEIPTLA